MSSLFHQELAYRRELWQRLLEHGGPEAVSPSLIKELRIHTAQHGIWVDKARTKGLTEDGSGVTFAIRHTESIYPDDLSTDGVLYHFPQTERGGHDLAEIEATKAAGKLHLPVFVIMASPRDPKRRDVVLGWVEDWDDDAQYFLITFEESQLHAAPKLPNEDSPLLIEEQLFLFGQERKTKPGEQRFKFRVFKRYGARCAVCTIRTRELLEVSRFREGSDDPRNGIVFCALHRRAYSLGLFAFNPATLEVRTNPNGPTCEDLRISRSSIALDEMHPHPDALAWQWEKWCRQNDIAEDELE